MLDFSNLSPLMRDLYLECVKIYYLMLPVFFALAVTVQWFRRGQSTVDFLDLFKRTLVSTLLLIALPEITSAILTITDGIALRIDAVQSLDQLLSVAQEKVSTYSASPTSILLQFNDMVLALCTFLSFLFVCIVRYLTLAMFHFFWLFLIVTAPLLLLFNIFASTSQIVANLFRGLIEVACWKIVWAILGVMLTSLSFGHMYLLEGSYVTVIVLNVIIAFAMLSTPLIVRSLVGSGIQSASPMLALPVAAAIIKVPTTSARLGFAINNRAPGSNGRTRSGASRKSFSKDKYEHSR